MVLLGCKPAGRTVEQHDIFFGIAHELRDLVPEMKAHWPEAKGRIHIDAWQEVRYANGYEITVQEKQPIAVPVVAEPTRLFFINLGGYKPGDFEEYHYKMVVAAADRKLAVQHAKTTAFFKHTGYEGAEAHIDDKYGIDVDDIYAIEEILADTFKEKYSISLAPTDVDKQNELNIGYFRLDKI
ncbi:MAG: hypothetical protein JWQ38_2252 [Flavipsychrobacter sp.]|nr:hypothetical protein [Flavipsychrobacter sp.]